MDRRSTLLSLAIPPLVLTAFVLGFFLRGRTLGSPRLGERVREVAGVIHERYYGDVTDEKLEREALVGMMEALDPYCQYFTRKDYEDFRRAVTGEFYGIGVLVEVDRDTGYVNVVTPIEDTPAFAEDILPGDKIVKVDGEDIKGLQLDDVVRKIKGPENTVVTLTLWRKDRNVFDLRIKRAKITIIAVKSKLLEGPHPVGYVRISDFTDMLPQFDRAIAELSARGMKGLVIDLRFNGGGLLDSAIELSDRFLPAGSVVVTTRERSHVEHRKAKDDARDLPAALPVVLLVNGASASASEVFAGCLRDHDRAKLVGARTFGKGSVQTPVVLSDGSCVKVTTARYFTPKGTSVHKEEGKKDYGLEPDYLVEMSDPEYVAVRDFWRQEAVVKGDPTRKPVPARDPQLEAAVEIVVAALEGRPARVERRELAATKAKDSDVPGVLDENPGD